MPEKHRRIDATGLKCPLPALRAQKALRDMLPGEKLVLLATDAAAKTDIPALCRELGHALLSIDERGGTISFTIARGPAAPAHA